MPEAHDVLGAGDGRNRGATMTGHDLRLQFARARRRLRWRNWPLHSKVGVGVWIPVLIVAFLVYTGPGRGGTAAPSAAPSPAAEPVVDLEEPQAAAWIQPAPMASQAYIVDTALKATRSKVKRSDPTLRWRKRTVTAAKRRERFATSRTPRELRRATTPYRVTDPVKIERRTDVATNFDPARSVKLPVP
jgi:hypothetical protein